MPQVADQVEIGWVLVLEQLAVTLELLKRSMRAERLNTGDSGCAR